MTNVELAGLVHGGRIGPEVLGHQGARFVFDRSDVPREQDDSGLWVCPLDRIFTEPKNPIIVFGVPNVALVFPNEDASGWDRFAAFMFWRTPSFVSDAKGRVQAGVFYELLHVSSEALAALKWATNELVGTRKASCAHSVALALHMAGFTIGNGKSLKNIYRPSRLASVLWRYGLWYNGQLIELRIIHTNKAVSDHFVSVWTREWTSPARLVKKVYYKAVHAPAPVFDPVSESVEMSSDFWRAAGPRTNIGVGLASNTGVNLGYVLGEQPEFTALLPEPIMDVQLADPLRHFPGELSKTTKVKKYVLFSRPVIWFMRRNLSQRVQWLTDVPTAAIPAMLKRSPGPERETAFVYNFVLTGTNLKVKRLLNANGRDQKFVNWMLAKHVLLAGYSKDVRLAGELWCYESPGGALVVCLSGESGTYQPTLKQTQVAADVLGKMFDVTVEIVARKE